MGYHDQVSAVQAIVRYLNSNTKGEAFFPPVSTADVFRSQYPGQPLPPGMLDPMTGATPEQVMAYWEDVTQAKKCADAKGLRLGVTDDHPTRPLISWTSLARTKDCPGFSEWWNALPEAKPYHRG